MKQLYLILLTLLTINLIDAQYYVLPVIQNGENPLNLNKDSEFPPGGGLTAGWTTILASPQLPGNWSTLRTIPFPFYFNGRLVSRYKASTAGVVTFNTKTFPRLDTNNIAIPTSMIPDSSICVWGLRTVSAAGDYVVTKTFGNAPYRQHWINYSSFSEQNLKSGWIYISIVLEESTNKIYIVDQRTSCREANGTACLDKTNLTVGIQIDANNAIMVNGTPDFQSENLNDPTSADNSYYEFIYGASRPDLDIEYQRHLVKNYILISEFPVPIVGVFRNIGNDPISKVTYNYNVDDGPVFTHEISGLNIDPLQDMQLTHKDVWTTQDVQFTMHTLKSWISHINDIPTLAVLDDTIYSRIIVTDAFFTRKLMHENFSSSTCAPCKPGNITLHNVLSSYSPDQYTEMNYHYYFPGTGDPYFTIEAIARGRYYAPINDNIFISSIPATILDGKTNLNPNGYTITTFADYQSIPSFYQIIPSGKIEGQKIDINVEIKTIAPTKSTTRLFVAVAEKNTYKNIKTNGETEFPHVMKKMLPDTLGTLVGIIPENSSKILNLSWTVPGKYRLPIDGRAVNIINLATEHSIEEFEDLEVIAWLQETDKTVLQSNSADLDFVVSNNNPVVKKEISVNPSPSSDYFFINMSAFNDAQELKVLIADATGKLVYADNTNLKSLFINSSNWNPGMYHIKVVGKNQEANKKIVVIE